MKTLTTSQELMGVIINIQDMKGILDINYDRHKDFAHLEKMQAEDLYKLQTYLIPLYNGAIKREVTMKDNKLIAEFMGTKSAVKNGYYFGDNGFLYPLQDLKYHSSFDWLMPVVGKISNKCEEPEELDSLRVALLCNDINTAYDCVVDYIENNN